jgi:hypothetical protein
MISVHLRTPDKVHKKAEIMNGVKLIRRPDVILLRTIMVDFVRTIMM